MDRPGGKHHLQAGFRILVADVFQVVHGLVFGVGQLDVADELLGVGIVTDIVDGGRDYEVTVDFDGPGTKKMFAAFARLQKV